MDRFRTATGTGNTTTVDQIGGTVSAISSYDSADEHTGSAINIGHWNATAVYNLTGGRIHCTATNAIEARVDVTAPGSTMVIPFGYLGRMADSGSSARGMNAVMKTVKGRRTFRFQPVPRRLGRARIKSSSGVSFGLTPASTVKAQFYRIRVKLANNPT